MRFESNKCVFVEMVVAICISLIVIIMIIISTVFHHVLCAGPHAGRFTCSVAVFTKTHIYS